MIVAMPLLTSALLIGSAQADLQDSKPAASEAASDAAAVRSTFLSRLRELAAQGNLFEPDSAARILEMKLHASTAPGRPPVACGDGTIKSSEVTTVVRSEPTWFRALPSGAGHIDVPAFMINPATRTGDPTFAYRVYHSVNCADWPRLRDRKEARISFNGLPAFACLTPASIAKEIPEARHIIATDGVSIMRWEGRVDDDAAVALEFVFRAGAACALGADITQDQQQGLRYLRAQDKYETCRAPSDREFCLKHPNVTWSDRELLRQMVMQAYERCGTVNSFYVKEPANAEPAPPLPTRERNSPCDGL